jgi:hypothetical protein
MQSSQREARSTYVHVEWLDRWFAWNRPLTFDPAFTESRFPRKSISNIRLLDDPGVTIRILYDGSGLLLVDTI